MFYFTQFLKLYARGYIVISITRRDLDLSTRNTFVAFFEKYVPYVFNVFFFENLKYWFWQKFLELIIIYDTTFQIL